MAVDDDLLERWLEDLLRGNDCLVDRASGFLRVGIPEGSAIEGVLEAQGDVRLQTRSAVSGAHRAGEVIPVTAGSYYLERLVRFALSSTPAGGLDVRLAPPLTGVDGLFVEDRGEEAVPRGVSGAMSAGETGWLFQFRATIDALDPERHLVPVLVLDGGDCVVVDRLGSWLASSDTAPLTEATAAGAPLATAYPEALRIAARWAARKLAHHRESRKKPHEVARAWLAEQRDEALEAARRETGGDVQLLNLALEQVRREWEGRVWQLHEAHVAKGVEIELLACTRIRLPVGRGRLSVGHPGRLLHSANVLWAGESPGLFDCPACSESADRVVVNASGCGHSGCAACSRVRDCGHSCCDNCTDACSVCGTSRCPACRSECGECSEMLCGAHAHACSCCESRWCAEHIEVAPACGHPACTECIVLCGECHEAVCTRCVAECGGCGEQYCARHIVACVQCHEERCPKCRGKRSCGHHACSQCELECAHCGGSMCQRCVNECKECGSTTCRKCGGRCGVCGAGTCKTCGHVDQQSRRAWCTDHWHPCAICSANVATRTCADCRMSFCRSHGSPCPECEEPFCNRCSLECAHCHKRYCREHITTFTGPVCATCWATA